jgi:hypothetical protein
MILNTAITRYEDEAPAPESTSPRFSGESVHQLCIDLILKKQEQGVSLQDFLIKCYVNDIYRETEYLETVRGNISGSILTPKVILISHSVLLLTKDDASILGFLGKNVVSVTPTDSWERNLPDSYLTALFYLIGIYAKTLESQIESIGRDFNTHTLSSKPALSLTSPQLMRLQSLSELCLDLYASSIRVLRVISDISAGRISSPYLKSYDARRLLEHLFMPSFGTDAPADPNRKYSTVLSSINLLNRYLSSSKITGSLLEISRLASSKLFSNTYKGIFLLTPPLSDRQFSTSNPSSNRYVMDAYLGLASDSRHFLYKLQKVVLSENPWMPKVPTYGIHMAIPAGPRYSKLGFKTVSAIRIPPNIKIPAIRKLYVEKVLTRYRRRVDAHFFTNWGIRVAFNTGNLNDLWGILDLGDSSFRKSATNQFRSATGATATEGIPYSDMRALPSAATSNLPYVVFNTTGEIKEEYRSSAIVNIHVELLTPVERVDAEMPEHLHRKYKEEMVGILKKRSFKNHPLYSPGSVLEDVTEEDFSDAMLQANTSPITIAREHALGANTYLLPFNISRRVEARNSRPTRSNNSAYSSADSGHFASGNLLTPYSNIVLSGNTVLHNKSNLGMSIASDLTRDFILASRDTITMSTTLSRRVIRAGLEK